MLNTINIYVIGKFTYSEQEKRKKKKKVRSITITRGLEMFCNSL